MAREAQPIHMLVDAWHFELDQPFKDRNVLRQPDHHWWLVDASDVGLMLNQLCEEPECLFFVAVIHQRCHDEVHALHVADRVVKVAEGAEDAAEAVVHRGLYLCEVGHVERELRHLRESAQKVFLDVRIESF